MLHPEIDKLETEFFAIMQDLSSKEIADVNILNKIRPNPIFIVKKENKGKTKSLFSDEFFAHSRYTLLDTNLRDYSFSESNWRLLSIFEPIDRSRKVVYRIADPNGEAREISNLDFNSMNWTEYFQIDGICKIIKYMRQLSHYPDWTYFDLIKENDTLKEENRYLNAKIKKLENDLNKVKNAGQQN